MTFELPSLPSDWAYSSLDLCAIPGSISYGIVQPGSPVGQGVPIIRVNNFDGTRLDLSDVMLIAPEVEEKYRRTRLNGGEVLLTLVGSVGQVAEVPIECSGFNVARAVGVIRPSNGIDAKWIAICLRSPLSQQLLSSRANTTVQTTINLKDVRALPIPIPPLPEREQIARFIAALDDRIALLRETNATLEAIAQALFKSWFVDFDPVRAKQRGLAPPAMDEEAALLFPASFSEAGADQIPQQWHTGTLAELAGLNTESWSMRSHPPHIAYIDLANVKDNYIGDATAYTFDAAPSRARRVLRGGDTIVGTVRPGNRSFAFVHDPAPGMTASTGFAVLRPKALQNRAFVYLAATQSSSIEYLAHLADGGAYPAVRPEAVAALTCVVPPELVLQAFEAATGPLLERCSANQKQARTLTTLRDTLLPRLISGRLRIPEAEAQFADAIA